MASRLRRGGWFTVAVVSCCVLTLAFHGRDFFRFMRLLVNIVTGIDLSP